MKQLATMFFVYLAFAWLLWDWTPTALELVVTVLAGTGMAFLLRGWRAGA